MKRAWTNKNRWSHFFEIKYDFDFSPYFRTIFYFELSFSSYQWVMSLIVKLLNLLILTFLVKTMLTMQLNPYCQILENISKNRVVTQRVSWKIFPGFFQNVWFRVMNEEHFWKIFPAEFHDYLLKKKRLWKSDHDSEGFLENFSRQISSIPTQEKML